MNQVLFEGKFYEAGAPLFTAANRGFRYGDGIFETIKVFRGQVLLKDFHFERLDLGMKMLALKNLPDTPALEQDILSLCRENDCEQLARVRVAVFRGENSQASIVAEAHRLDDEANRWNEEGFTLELYPFARKSTDGLANLKSANYLPYVLAAHYAAEKGVDDCLVLNVENAICDSSRANLFLIRGEEIFTPALHQGCVSGVMRRFVMDELKRMGLPVKGSVITLDDMEEADEVFLTNAIQGMRWVSRFREKNYSNTMTAGIYKKLLDPLYR
jgi:branched-chain amino acid aminotransferase